MKRHDIFTKFTFVIRSNPSFTLSRNWKLLATRHRGAVRISIETRGLSAIRHDLGLNFTLNPQSKSRIVRDLPAVRGASSKNSNSCTVLIYARFLSPEVFVPKTRTPGQKSGHCHAENGPVLSNNCVMIPDIANPEDSISITIL